MRWISCSLAYLDRRHLIGRIFPLFVPRQHLRFTSCVTAHVSSRMSVWLPLGWGPHSFSLSLFLSFSLDTYTLSFLNTYHAHRHTHTPTHAHTPTHQHTHTPTHTNTHTHQHTHTHQLSQTHAPVIKSNDLCPFPPSLFSPL